MIKQIIHLNFHINYSQILDNTNYLYGSRYEKYKGTDSYVKYKEDNYIFKIDKEFNIERQFHISNRTWVDLVYYKENHFIFKYQDDEYQYFQTLDGEKISIPLKDKKSHIIFSDKLFIFNPKDGTGQNILVYNNFLDKIINFNISYQEVLDCYREKAKMETFEKISNCLTNCSVIGQTKTDDEYIAIAFNESNRYNVVRLDLNFNIKECKEISIDNKSLFHSIYKFKEFYYAIFSISDTIYIIKKFNSKFNLIDEEKIKTYRCDIISMNDNVCLIVDDPKRYNKDQKQYNKQELMGNSSLLVLE